jgi:hypothetical protein
MIILIKDTNMFKKMVENAHIVHLHTQKRMVHGME